MKNEMTQGFDDPVKFRDEWDKQTEGKQSLQSSFAGGLDNEKMPSK